VGKSHDQCDGSTEIGGIWINIYWMISVMVLRRPAVRLVFGSISGDQCHGSTEISGEVSSWITVQIMCFSKLSDGIQSGMS
jgi:hypothetical protein